ncbi:MAG: (2E,6E)-farnesyl diphosphate synthase [Gammaproteobacteria bacterium]|nr:(2E,6E)-farnesyl diphosphate synthase [Gammaproteobacteria bacterium]NVK89103.1 (2E,6E)-farnesyl diphosphate synthase [Gammaproteobacteria bacterium]
MDFATFCAEHRARVEAALDAALPSASAQPQRLHQAMRYSALNPGKRTRPLLVYATGQMLDAADSQLDAPAMAVELIHAYSLIHDDLPCMDDDELRRGLPTCHIKFDEATAVLAGDALQTLAFAVLLPTDPQLENLNAHFKMLKQLTFASGSLGMGGGQAIDLAATGQTLTLAELENMHLMKTGALIEASVLLGYWSSGRDRAEEVQALRQYSRAIGLAFQIRDDILDIESDTATLGKPQGSDLERNKATYPALLGLDGAKHHAQHQLQLALEALRELPYNSELLQQFAQHIIERDR